MNASEIRAKEALEHSALYQVGEMRVIKPTMEEKYIKLADKYNDLADKYIELQDKYIETLKGCR